MTQDTKSSTEKNTKKELPLKISKKLRSSLVHCYLSIGCTYVNHVCTLRTISAQNDHHSRIHKKRRKSQHRTNTSSPIVVNPIPQIQFTKHPSTSEFNHIIKQYHAHKKDYGS